MGAQADRAITVEEDHWWFVTMRRAVARAVTDHQPTGRVLDVGCGTGRVLAELPERYERVGLDVDPRALEHAAARPGVTTVEGSITELPFEDASFDGLICINVLGTNGVVDDQAAVDELGRVLRPGGTLVLMAAAYDWLLSGHDVLAASRKRFTRREFRRMLAGVGPARVSYRVSSPLPLAIVSRLVVHRGSAHTDVRPVAAPLNSTLRALVSAEDAVMRRVGLPFGLSVFAVATRR